MVYCVKIMKNHAEKALKILRESGLIAREYSVFHDENHVYIPVYNGEEASNTMNNAGILFEIVTCNPPVKNKKNLEHVYIPSYDLLGDAVIIREKVLEHISVEELVETIKKVHPGVKAIYAKIRTIDEFRVPELRLLWGEPLSRVIVKEYGLSFIVRLGKVYYNKRLSEEHHRLAAITGDNEHIADIFSGIGGFSIHIASLRKSLILANDINPYAFVSIIDNIFLNRKKLRGTIYASGADATLFAEHDSLSNYFDRVIANLPHKSTEYMWVYQRILRDGGFLHLYMVGKDPEELFRRLEKYKGWRITGYSKVLDYAPYTYIYRFDLVKS